ncbi:MAG: hypothetical protein ACM3XM_02265 [Mycobacterium leprae]
MGLLIVVVAAVLVVGALWGLASWSVGWRTPVGSDEPTQRIYTEPLGRPKDPGGVGVDQQRGLAGLGVWPASARPFSVQVTGEEPVPEEAAPPQWNGLHGTIGDASEPMPHQMPPGGPMEPPSETHP